MSIFGEFDLGMIGVGITAAMFLFGYITLK